MVSEEFDVCLIVAGQPATNPRTTKEAVCLHKNGYKICVLYAFSTLWADNIDEKILNDNPDITWKLVGGHPIKDKFNFGVSRIFYQLFKLFSKLHPTYEKYIVNRASFALIKQAEKIKARIYVAHNLAGLPAAANAAKQNQCIYSFDAEDYHRGQSAEGSTESILASKIEDKYIPGAAFVSAASSLIASAYENHYAGLKLITINNVFSIKYLCPKLNVYKHQQPLRLFWFSQTVGNGRGIEEVIEAMGSANEKKLQLTLLGSCSNEMKAHFLSIAKRSGLEVSQINFIKATSEEQLFNIASQHHIGLALEINDTLNRRICLTNKLFTYLLSGLAVIATDTPAQKLFINAYPGIGKYYEQGDISKLAAILKYHLENPDILNAQRLAALELGKNRFNWEKESPALIDFFRSNLAS